MSDNSSSSDEVLPSSQSMISGTWPEKRGQGIGKKNISMTQPQSQVIQPTKRSYKKPNPRIVKTEKNVPVRTSPRKRTVKSGGGGDGGGPSGVDPSVGVGGGGVESKAKRASKKIKLIEKTIRGKEVTESVEEVLEDEPFVHGTQDISQNMGEEN